MACARTAPWGLHSILPPWLLAASLALAVWLPQPAGAGVTLSAGRSGLPWASGTSNASVQLERWRGRRLDVSTVYMAMDNWRDIVRSAEWVSPKVAGARLVLAQPMLPASHRGRHAECAQGRYDSYIRALGNGLVRNGAGNAVIRLGWEANRMGGFPWAVTGDGSSYKACFRRWVAVLRATPGERFLIDWHMSAGGNLPYHVDRIYPGGDVVDIMGVGQYDTCPPIRSVADWQEKIHKRNRTGGPFGLATWLAYAQSKGKALSIPEWGIGGPRDLCRKPGFDNPLYIRMMHEFLRDHARAIAYESYFNGDGGRSPRLGTHQLFPSRYNPRAAAAYRALW
ncbi:MAG: hypothetical protein U1E17_24125 [Geminicoccaceae bacterium]